MYKQILNRDSSLDAEHIIRIADNACIPFDPDNTDYQQYLAWLAEGNQPEAAE